MRVDSLGVAGMEGAQDSFLVGTPGPYYVTTTNNMGESCASNVAYVSGSPTGVDPNPVAHDQVIVRRYFDVSGRYRGKQKPQVAGVYFEKEWRKSGRTETRKVVVLK